MAMTNEEKIAKLEKELIRVEKALYDALYRIVQLERATLPLQRFGSPDPSYMQPGSYKIKSEPSCMVCGIEFKNMTGYVCNNPLCSNRVTCQTS